MIDSDLASTRFTTSPAVVPESAVADLAFLASLERDPAPGPAAMRRVMQIRRANPELAAAIRQQSAGG